MTTPYDQMRALIDELERDASTPRLPAWMTPHPIDNPAAACLDLGAPVMRLGQMAGSATRDPDAAGELAQDIIRRALGVAEACGWTMDATAPAVTTTTQPVKPAAPKAPEAPGVPDAQLRALRVLADGGPQRAREIGRGMGRSISRIRGLIQVMRQAGLVYSVERGLYDLTDKGREALASALEDDDHDPQIPAHVARHPKAIHLLWWAHTHGRVVVGEAAEPLDRDAGLVSQACADQVKRGRMVRATTGVYHITEAGIERLRNTDPALIEDAKPSPPTPSPAPQAVQAAPVEEIEEIEEAAPVAEAEEVVDLEADEIDGGDDVHLTEEAARHPWQFRRASRGKKARVEIVDGVEVRMTPTFKHGSYGLRVDLPDGRSDWKPCHESAARWARRMIEGDQQEAAA